MDQHELETTARALVAPGKGILAADESTRTIKKRLDTVGVPSTEETRRAYRDLLFTAPGIEPYISGVIMYDETIRQASHDGVPFPQLLAQRGIIPGIKVDLGTVDLPGYPGEKITEGLDGLRNRLSEYRQLGARFAKWRAVYAIGDGTPTCYGMDANAQALARYAALCQEAGLTPIVEPEVLMDGDHTAERCAEVTEQVLHRVFAALEEARVAPEGMLLKPNMILPGEKAAQRLSPPQVADLTVRTLRRVVPAAVPGIVFLSGGQRAQEATENLNALNRTGPQPWALSFSYGRALQEAALKLWHGDAHNTAPAQEAFRRRAELCSAARAGRYLPEMEAASA